MEDEFREGRKGVLHLRVRGEWNERLVRQSIRMNNFYYDFPATFVIAFVAAQVSPIQSGHSE